MRENLNSSKFSVVKILSPQIIPMPDFILQYLQSALWNIGN